jgi:signal transduction histidine kinase
MRQVIIIIILLICIISLFADARIDSLEARLDNITGKEKVKVLNDLALAHVPSNPEKIEHYARQALALAEKLDLKKESSRSYKLIGVFYYITGEYDQSIEYYLKSLRISEEIDDKQGVADTYNNIGLCKWKQGDYDQALENFSKSVQIKEEISGNGIAASLANIGIIYAHLIDYEQAMEYFHKALKIWEEMGNEYKIAFIYSSIGIVFDEQGFYEEALEYHHKALEVFEEIGDKWNIANTYSNIGIIKERQNNFKLALDYYLIALKIREEIGEREAIATSNNLIGDIYRRQDDYEQALQFHLKALKIQEEIGAKTGIASSYIALGHIYSQLKQYVTAFDYLQRGLDLAREIGARTVEIDSFKYLSELFEMQQDFKQALYYYKEYSDLHKEIHNAEKSEQIADMQTKYETEKKEKENELLRSENAIHKLELEKQKYIRLRLYFGLVLIFGLVFFIYYRYRAKQKLNRILKEKIKQALEKQLQQQQILVQKSKLESLGQLSAGIAHEINQPLGGISMALGNIDYRFSTDKLNKEYFQTKLQGLYGYIDRIKQIIDHIRIFSRDQKSVEIDNIDVNNTINNALSMVQTQYTSHNIMLEVDLEENIGLTLGNQYKLEQVILNLLSNAKDSLDEKEKISEVFRKQINITSYSDIENIFLEIKDNGIGIPEEIRERMFEPFFTTKEAESGTGLGLSISYGIIKAMNGEISVESREGEFTKIIVLLPKIKSAIRKEESVA